MMEILYSWFAVNLSGYGGYSHPRRLDPFVLYLQHGRNDVKCKPPIYRIEQVLTQLIGKTASMLCKTLLCKRLKFFTSL